MPWTITLPEFTEYRKNGKPEVWRMPPSPNKRMHWTRAGRIRHFFEDQVQLLLAEAKVPKGMVHVRLEFRYYTDHPMDKDNLAAAMKGVVDAMTGRKRGGRINFRQGYGLVADDTQDKVEATYESVPRAGGRSRAEVTITEICA